MFLVAVGALVAVVLPAAPASAHPLGNFTVNHYDGLRFDPDGVSDVAVVDAAEIPTAQAAPSIDTDGDGVASAAERSVYADRRCASLAAAVQLTVEGRTVPFVVGSRLFTYRPGVAGLRTSRLECRLRAMATMASPTTAAFTDGFEASRVGWHEITAVGTGVRLEHCPVPQRSISDGLLHYPNDLLSSPLDVRAATLHLVPGAGASSVKPGANMVPSAGILDRGVNQVTTVFNHLVGRRHLTVAVGLAAVALALLLGAAHAALPGHGKTVMAAYIAGRQGSVRDAFVVGATVTATHTGGVLALGLALTLSASLAGEAILQVLGVVSGLLVAGLGAGLLIGALRQRRAQRADAAVVPAAEPIAAPALVLVGAGGPPVTAPHDHGFSSHAHGHSSGGHTHSDSHRHGHPAPAVVSRRGLVGMGIAGGLVPSPSALVVLLAAVALGRTLFGIALVLAYGLGMAGTLTVAGLVLVKVRDRYRGRLGSRRSVAGTLARRWADLIPITTACLVIVVGLGLGARGAGVV